MTATVTAWPHSHTVCVWEFESMPHRLCLFPPPFPNSIWTFFPNGILMNFLLIINSAILPKTSAIKIEDLSFASKSCHLHDFLYPGTIYTIDLRFFNISLFKLGSLPGLILALQRESGSDCWLHLCRAGSGGDGSIQAHLRISPENKRL